MTTTPTFARPFVWHVIDVRSHLPENWMRQLNSVAASHSKQYTLVPESVTSREADAVRALDVLTAAGDVVARELPWLDELYRGHFRELASTVFAEPVHPAENVAYGVNLNVQRGSAMRYEAHVDSNPIGGLLYATTHPPGSGGELVVSNRGDVRGIDEIERDCSRVYPVAGHLVLFDARHHSHFVAPLEDPDGLRVVAAMNFYTADCPEGERPPDLSPHLFGSDQSHNERQHA